MITENEIIEVMRIYYRFKTSAWCRCLHITVEDFARIVKTIMLIESEDNNE